MDTSSEDALLNLDVWRRSRALAVKVCSIPFSFKDRFLRDQISRAAVSVPSNIAEGYERNSPREFAAFLRIARGSCAELRTQLYIAQELGCVDGDAAREMQEEALAISKMLQGLINYCHARLDA